MKKGFKMRPKCTLVQKATEKEPVLILVIHSRHAPVKSRGCMPGLAALARLSWVLEPGLPKLLSNKGPKLLLEGTTSRPS